MDESSLLLHTQHPRKVGGLLLLGLCALLLFPFLGEMLYNTRGEPREAIVAVAMRESGNWILPTNNGTDIAYKPPLFHWCVALCSLFAGKVTEFASRVPSALALSLIVWSVYAFYARRKGVGVAFLTGFLTLTNFEMHRSGTHARVDMLVSAWMVLALLSLFEDRERGDRGLPLRSVLLLSAAFLTKGPVGLALPCLTAGVFRLLRGEGFGKVVARLAGIGIAACILPLCWYAAAYNQGGERFLRLVMEENFLRFLGKMTYASHLNPWYYYFFTLLSGFLPYALLVVMSMCVLKYRRVRLGGGVCAWWGKLKGFVSRTDDVKLYSLLCVVVIFLFYSCLKSKRSVYIMPIYPFAAYFLAEYVRMLCKRHAGVVKSFGWVLAGLALVVTALFVGLRAGLLPDNLFASSKEPQGAAFWLALRHSGLAWWKWVVVLLPALAAGCFICLRRKRTFVLGIGALVTALLLALDGVYQPVVLNVKSDKPLAAYIARKVPEGTIYSYRKDVTKGNPLHPFTINFYLGDRVVPFESALPGEGFLIVSGDSMEEFQKVFPSYAVELVKDFQHRSCDDRKPVTFWHFKKVPPGNLP